MAAVGSEDHDRALHKETGLDRHHETLQAEEGEDREVWDYCNYSVP